MTTQKLNKELNKLLSNSEDFSINFVKVSGYNKENKTAKKLIISLNSYSSGENVLILIKEIIDDFMDSYGIYIETKYIEF